MDIWLKVTFPAGLREYIVCRPQESQADALAATAQTHINVEHRIRCAVTAHTEPPTQKPTD
jgi:hypothetical protein